MPLCVISVMLSLTVPEKRSAFDSKGDEDGQKSRLFSKNTIEQKYVILVLCVISAMLSLVAPEKSSALDSNDDDDGQN